MFIGYHRRTHYTMASLEEERQFQESKARLDSYMDAVVEVVKKYKPMMIEQRLTKAKIRCPICQVKGALHLRLSQHKHRGHYPMSMKCETPKCLMMME